MGEKLYWLGFSVFSGIGPTKFRALLVNFGSAKDAWLAKKDDLRRIIGESLAPKFEAFRKGFSIEGYAKALEKKGISFLILEDPQYPNLLKQIKNPPFVLYVKSAEVANKDFHVRSASKLHLLNPVRMPAGSHNENFVSSPHFNFDLTKTIAVVGTRRITQYGREVTEIFTRELSAAGFTIVSGLALGVDAVAHQTAIEAGGKTIAVLGSGCDLCFPLENQPIYNSIVAGAGCLVSEFPLGMEPTKWSFPARNRIIAGLAEAVLVTEGAEDSGSLITADYAFKNNRKVFAVPGPITSSFSQGPYKLIQKGAKLVTRAEDILKEFSIFPAKRDPASLDNSQFSIKSERSKINPPVGGQSSKFQNATEEENRILKLLENEQLNFDEIVRRSEMNSAKAGTLLTMMEIKGMIKNLESGYFKLDF